MMDWNKVPVPPMTIQDYHPDKWGTWFTDFKLRTFSTPFPRLGDSEKVAVLLLKLGTEITPIFETFGVDVDSISYNELIRRFTVYFRPAKARNVFLNLRQKSGETFKQFSERLRALSYPCGFGPLQDGLIRDLFLKNMDDKYSNVRDKILESYADPNLLQVVDLANKLLLEECLMGSASANNEVPTLTSSYGSGANLESKIYCDECTVAGSSGAPTHDGTTIAGVSTYRVGSNPRNLMKRKEMDQDFSPTPNCKDSLSKLNFEAPPSEAFTPLRPNLEQQSSKTSYSPALNNTRPVTLANAIKKTLDIPQLDLAFKFVSINDAGNNSPQDCSNKNLNKPNCINSSHSEPPLSFSFTDENCAKPAGVSSRLLKYGNGNKGGTSVRSTKSSGVMYPRTEPRINEENTPPRSITKNSLSHVNIWASKSGNDVGRVNTVGNKAALGTDQMRSRVTPSQSINDGVFTVSTSNTATDNLSQKYSIRRTGLNSELDPKSGPPVSKHCFSDVVVVFISENDTIYVCPVVKFQYLGTIESDLRKLYEQNALQQISKMTVGQKYAAPFKGDWYRAEIILANIRKKTARISFCDYGNEEDISLSDLRLLPENFQDLEPLSFPIRLPKDAPEIRSGCSLKIRPLFLEEDWSWAVELRTNPLME